MRTSGITSVSVVLTAAAISLPFLASAVAQNDFGFSVCISGTTAVAGANVHALYAGRAYLFEA